MGRHLTQSERLTRLITLLYKKNTCPKDYLQLDMRLLAYGYLRADVGVLLVLGEVLVAAGQHVPQPAQHLPVVVYLALDQFLAYVV